MSTSGWANLPSRIHRLPWQDCHRLQRELKHLLLTKHPNFRDLNLGTSLAPSSTSCIRSLCNILGNFMPTRQARGEESPRPKCLASCHAFLTQGATQILFLHLLATYLLSHFKRSVIYLEVYKIPTIIYPAKKLCKKKSYTYDILLTMASSSSCSSEN